MVEIHKKTPLVCMKDVEYQELKWLWYPYIPFGVMTMIYGEGGIGKSHISIDIAARVSTGVSFPGETATRPPQKVLLLSGEDDPNSVIRPRLERAKADLANVFIPEDTFILDPRGIQELEEDMRECAATIVIIDPIVLYMGSKVDMNKANEVRGLMGALHRAAQRSGTAMVVVGHTKKSKEGNQKDQLMGSADFSNSIRSGLFVEGVPSGRGGIIHHPKHNYSAQGADLPYIFEDGTFTWGDPMDGAGYIDSGPKPKPKAAAVAFLREMLKDGPVPAKEIEALAADEGINATTLNRAKVGVAESFASRHDGVLGWYWRLIEGAAK